MPSNFNVIGKSVQRVGAPERLSGTAQYSADVDIQNPVILKVVRSTKPHSEINNINVIEALKVPGCLAVFTYKDIPGKNRFGIINKDQPLLAEKKVRFVGDAIALVAAASEEAADLALELIKIDYIDLPAVFDPEEALRPGAPLIHEKGNILGRRVVKRGNPVAAFERAAIVIDRVYTTQFVEHTYIEPDAGSAHFDDDGTLVIHASTQNPHYDQKDVAELLALDEPKVRIKQAATGGGFGSKLDLNVQGFVGLAAYLLNRPAKLIYTREEAFLCTSKRHPLKIHYKTAASKDGRLLAVKVKIIGDTGAYASYGLAVVSRSAVHATGPYEVPNVDIESIFAYTNNCVAGAMRGFGVPQMAFAHESQMDLLAEAVGVSPLEIRRRNCLRIGSVTGTGQQLQAGVGIDLTIDKIEDFLSQPAKHDPAKPFALRGKGIGCMMYGIGNTGMQNPATAQIELTIDGGIVLYTGAADIGQGSSTVLSQIAAQEFNIDPAGIKLVVADTGLTTSAGATSASRQTYISGNAVLEASRKLKDVMLTQAATILKTDRGKLASEGHFIIANNSAGTSVSFSDIAHRLSKTGIPLKWQGFFDPDTTPLDDQTGQGNPYATFAFASHAAEVEVDILTGAVRVIKIVAAHDVGKAINPQGVHGQIYSGVAMGLGYAIMEEFHPMRTESMKDYHIPTISDMPEVESIIVEDPEPTGPYGAKGVGEPALIPTAPAILNAIADAIGTRIYDLPANLERVIKASVAARNRFFRADERVKTNNNDCKDSG